MKKSLVTLVFVPDPNYDNGVLTEGYYKDVINHCIDYIPKATAEQKNQSEENKSEHRWVRVNPYIISTEIADIGDTVYSYRLQTIFKLGDQVENSYMDECRKVLVYPEQIARVHPDMEEMSFKHVHQILTKKDIGYFGNSGSCELRMRELCGIGCEKLVLNGENSSCCGENTTLEPEIVNGKVTIYLPENEEAENA